MNEQDVINDINATLRALEALIPMARMQGKIEAVCIMYTSGYLLKLRAMK